MKCKYCNSEIEGNEKFCPYCGKEVKMADTLQPSQKSKSSAKWLWIFVGVILLVGLVGGSGYYFTSDKGESNFHMETDSIANATGEDVNMVEASLQKIISSLITENGDKYLPIYFTESFNTYYKRACEKAMKEGFESPRIWWQESESDPSQFVINSVSLVSESEAKSNVTLKSEISECNFEVIVKKENGNWLIDKITQKQEYLPVDEKATAMDATAERDISTMERNNESVGSNCDGYDRLLSERKLSDSDLTNKSKKELEIMRNSIYARYGYRFKRNDLLNHFSQYSWYKPTTNDMAIVYQSMSDIEKYNVDFIKKHE